MMITNEQRIEKYQSVDEKLQGLYASPESGEKMGSVFKKHNLPQEQYQKYAETIGDTILGFYRVAELPERLQATMGISLEQAKNVTTDLLEFLDPVINREDTNALKKNEMLNLADSFAKKVAPEPSEATTTAEEVPQKEGAMHASHTMEDDMRRVHGYGTYRHNNPREDEVVTRSNQDDVLKKE